MSATSPLTAVTFAMSLGLLPGIDAPRPQASQPQASQSQASRPQAPALQGPQSQVSTQPVIWISVLAEDGRARFGLAARDLPYLGDCEALGMPPGIQCRPGVAGPVSRPIRDDHDHVVSGYGFHAWRDGPNVQVLLLLQAPAPGEENRHYSTRSPQLTFEAYRMYTLPVGAIVAIPEARSLGLGSLTLRVEQKPIR